MAARDVDPRLYILCQGCLNFIGLKSWQSHWSFLFEGDFRALLHPFQGDSVRIAFMKGEKVGSVSAEGEATVLPASNCASFVSASFSAQRRAADSKNLQA